MPSDPEIVAVECTTSPILMRYNPGAVDISDDESEFIIPNLFEEQTVPLDLSVRPKDIATQEQYPEATAHAPVEDAVVVTSGDDKVSAPVEEPTIITIDDYENPASEMVADTALLIIENPEFFTNGESSRFSAVISKALYGGKDPLWGSQAAKSVADFLLGVHGPEVGTPLDDIFGEEIAREDGQWKVASEVMTFVPEGPGESLSPMWDNHLDEDDEEEKREDNSVYPMPPIQVSEMTPSGLSTEAAYLR